MNGASHSNTVAKLQWEAPKLIELEMGLGDVHNGFNAGNDGNGGFTTSLS
jgi:hypothetical protein